MKKYIALSLISLSALTSLPLAAQTTISMPACDNCNSPTVGTTGFGGFRDNCAEEGLHNPHDALYVNVAPGSV